MTDNSSDITDLSSTKLLKNLNNENKLPDIPPYSLENKYKDWNNSDGKPNFVSTTFRPHEKQLSPTATSTSALPG